MKVLVTGGAGYIGSLLVPALLGRGYQVTVVDNFMFKQSSLLDCCHSNLFSVVRGDCRDESLMAALIKEADAVIPLAALVGMPLCKIDPIGTKTINYDAVRLICKLASSSQLILIPTTNSGYGVGEKGKFCTEKTPLTPISAYGKAKVDAEKEVLDRENSISFRLATVFGVSPRMRIDLLVNDFVYRAVNDNAVVIFEGHFMRNYIHVRDVVRVFLHGLDNFAGMRGHAYNVGLEDANLSKIQLCEEIKKEVPTFTYLEADIGEDPDKRDYIVSNQKILKTGFSPNWTLSEGIKELVKAYAVLQNRIYGNV